MDTAHLIKVLEGRADQAETEAFSHWMALSELNRVQFAQVRQLWILSHGPWPPPSSYQSLDRIRKQIKKNHNRSKLRITISSSVSLLTLLICAWIFWPTTSAQKQLGENVAFNHISLKEMADDLEVRFQTRINITKPELEACFFTGSFSKTTTLADIMNAISFLHHINIENSQDGYEWKGKGC